MVARPLPDIDYLRQCFDLDPEIGALMWRDRPRAHFKTDGGWRKFNAKFSGLLAGSVWERPNGRGPYIRVRLGPLHYLAHRIVWAITHGVDPGEFDVDHRDADGLNNRPGNLRLATCAQNQWNSRNQRASRLKGTRLINGRWQARIRHDGKMMNLGCFGTEASAHQAYCLAASKLRGEFARFE